MHSAATMWIRIDARIALVLFLLLLLSAATPVVMAWLALLPPERDPFANPREPRPKKPRDAFAIFLLANVSLSVLLRVPALDGDRKSTPLNSSHGYISYAVFCLKKKKK